MRLTSLSFTQNASYTVFSRKIIEKKHVNYETIHYTEMLKVKFAYLLHRMWEDVTKVTHPVTHINTARE